MRFTELPIPEAVQQGIRDCGFSECTPVQAQTLPIALAGRDVAGQAQTGTGKTAAFLIAGLTRLLEKGVSAPPDKPRSAPRMLIIAPTRELAVQIERDALALGAHTGLKMAAVYGGVDYERQRNTLQNDAVDILIGTPGRLIDYLKQKVYTVSHVEVLVIDEADRLFDMGFITDLRFMLRRLPPYEQRLSMLFSATLGWRAQELSYEYMNDPEITSTDTGIKTADKVSQLLYHVEGSRKIFLLLGILRRDLIPEASAQGKTSPDGRIMIFVNTKRMGERLKEWLEANGISAGYLSGDVHQSKRLKVLGSFQEGQIPVLIATDVAGRGLHIDGVTHVINYDLPDDAENYVHRIGRTARAGQTGDAISLVDEDGAYNLEAIESLLGTSIPVGWAEESLFLSDAIRPPRSRSRRPETRPPARGDRGSSSGGGRGSSSGGGRSTSARSGEGERPRRERRPKPAEGAAPPSPSTPIATSEGSPAPAKRRRRRRPSATNPAPSTPTSGETGE